MKPLYVGNVMAVPLGWGTMELYYLIRALVPLYYRAKNGVAFVLDSFGVLRLAGFQRLERELANWIEAKYDEDYSMTLEYPGDPDDVEVETSEILTPSKLRVTIRPVTSLTMGRSGLKVVFNPPHEVLDKL